MLLLVLLLWLGSKGLLDLVAWHRPPRRKIPKDKKTENRLIQAHVKFLFSSMAFAKRSLEQALD